MKRHLTSLFKKRPSALETKYQEQIKQDSETISKSVKALVILIAILETIRVVVSEIILKGPIRWDEVFTYLSFSVFLCVLVLGKVIFAEKIPNEYKKYTKIISPICVLCYCGIITFVLIRQLESYVRDFSDQRDSFDFIGIGLLVIPNLIISDVLFNHWFLKCLLPLWQLLNLAVILTQYDPLNLAALLFMIFEFSFDIVLIFWIKDNLRWRVFLQRMAANQWNQIHSEILKNIPDNVAVYDFNGTLLFENEFFKSLREKIGSEDVVKIVRGIKKRGKFDSLKSYVIETQLTTQKKESLGNLDQQEPMSIHNHIENFSLTERVFDDLEQVFEVLKYLYQERLVLNKDSFIFDGKCFIEPTGDTISIEIRVSIFVDSETNSQKFLVIFRDTTQRDIVATLESNNKFKDNILSSLSHELKTPLSGIKTLTEACLQDKNVADKVKEDYVKPTLRSAILLGSVINDILDYSLYNKKNLSLEFKKVNIRELLLKNYKLMKNHYEKKAVSSEIEIDSEIPEYITTDPSRLAQVILNLLSNAFKFTEKGSISFKAQMEGENLRITTRDTGVGMDEDTMKNLENILPESLSGGKICNTSTGAGLGLTISQITASMLGPKEEYGIHFESKFHQGSTFTFLIEDKEDSGIIDFEVNHHKKIGSLRRLPPESRFGGLKIREDKSPSSRMFKNSSSAFSVCFEEEEDNLPLSTIRIMNPLKYVSDRQPSNKQLESTTRRSQTKQIGESLAEILVVDDEPINILALELVLKQFGKPVDKAYGGKEAIELIESRLSKRMYKVVFMDLNMPAMDGFEATRKIREKLKDDGGLKIVACTAYQESEYKEKCLEAGMDDFISKPISKDQISNILEKYNCF